MRYCEPCSNQVWSQHWVRISSQLGSVNVLEAETLVFLISSCSPTSHGHARASGQTQNFSTPSLRDEVHEREHFFFGYLRWYFLDSRVLPGPNSLSGSAFPRCLWRRMASNVTLSTFDFLWKFRRVAHFRLPSDWNGAQRFCSPGSLGGCLGHHGRRYTDANCGSHGFCLWVLPNHRRESLPSSFAGCLEKWAWIFQVWSLCTLRTAWNAAKSKR